MPELIVDRSVTLETDERVMVADLLEVVEVAKALSSELRVRILKALAFTPMNVLEIAQKFDLPPSTAAINVRKLEEAGLLTIAVIPGTRGTQKMCSTGITKFIINVKERKQFLDETNAVVIMPVGEFVDCQVSPTCGMVSDTSIIGELDDPRYFYDPDRIHAQLIWFRRGFLEYRFPNRVPPANRLRTLELSLEICSEAPMYNENWPSDITVWINGREVGTWTSPGDFGGERGYLTPAWWGVYNTQYGLLKTWRVSEDGSYVDGVRVSDLRISELKIEQAPFVAVRIGIKPDALNDGGLNLFGRRFGNYETDIMMRFDCVHESLT